MTVVASPRARVSPSMRPRGLQKPEVALVESSDRSKLPEVLTVEEAAEVLRISRNTAYALARAWRDSGGREGLPVIELGRNLRVPRAGLDRLLNGDLLPTASLTV